MEQLRDNPSHPWCLLPAETLFQIALKLPLNDIIALCSINAEWGSICSDEYLWKQLVRRDFPMANNEPPRPWRDFYQRLHEFPRLVFYLRVEEEHPGGSSKKDDVEEYHLLEEKNRSIVESLDLPFVIVPGKPLYDIEGDRVYFYFPVHPTRPDLTVDDFISFYRAWREALKKENRIGEEFFMSYGHYPGYEIENISPVNSR